MVLTLVTSKAVAETRMLSPLFDGVLHSIVPMSSIRTWQCQVHTSYLCQAGKHPINLQGDSKKVWPGGEGFDIFGQDPKFSFWAILDHFGPFFVMDDLDSSNFAREWHQSSPGSATKQTKIQVVAVFTGFLTKFGTSRLKN